MTSVLTRPASAAGGRAQPVVFERDLAVLEVRREGNAIIDGAPAGSSPLYTSALAKS